jgi:hypothetical protein
METEIGADNNIGNIEGLIKQLGLQAQDQELFIGKVRSFPVGLKFIGSNESLLLLCQIRYPVDAEAKGISKLDYGTEVADLIKEKKVEISVEDKIAWLTIPQSGPLIESNIVARILNSVLAGFEKAGIAGLQDKCHYCQVEAVESLICRDGKVAQICTTCLAGKSQAQTANLRLEAGGIAKACVLGTLASLVGAVAWAAVWVGYDKLFDLLNVKHIVVPRILTLFVLVGVGFLVGGPVGFILKKIPNRGDLLAGWLAIVFAICSVVFGEVIFAVWLVYREIKVISFSIALKLMPRYLADSGVYFITERILFGFVCVVVAYQIGRPKKKGLKL